VTACSERLPQGHPATKLIAIAVVSLLVACGGGAESELHVEPIEIPPSAIDPGVVAPAKEADDDPVAPLQIQVVELYFPSAEDDGLVAEAREIFATAAPGDRAKQIVADLISGPATELALRAIPSGTRLRQIYVLEGGVAYVDFSDDLRDGLGGGSTEELFAVYSVVDSVVLNIPEIERVGILIDGESIDTLNGHMDLRRPLRANIDLIIGRIASAQGSVGSEIVADNEPERDRIPGAVSGS
jgi:spore germination protein GerM